MTTAFKQYLQLYEIDPVKLSMLAQVRYGTVYNAQKGNPITPENAEKIRQAVFQSTGVPYVGSFVLIEESPSPEQFPTLRVKQFPRESQCKAAS